MFKIFLTLVLSSLAFLVWAQADPKVVARTIQVDRLETIFVAQDLKESLLADQLVFTEPFLYLVNPQKPSDFEKQALNRLNAYALSHPEEVAIWQAKQVEVKLRDQGRRIFEQGILDDIEEMVFRGQAQLEFGYGSGRSFFESSVLKLIGKDLKVPGPFVWATKAWNLKGPKAQATLQDQQMSEVLPESASLVELSRVIDTLQLQGPVSIEGQVFREDKKTKEEVTVTMYDQLKAVVTEDRVSFESQGRLKLLQSDMEVVGQKAKGRLGSSGWEWISFQSPQMKYWGANFSEDVLHVKGDFYNMAENFLVIEGNPVEAWNSELKLTAVRARYDMVRQKLRFENPVMQALESRDPRGTK